MSLYFSISSVFYSLLLLCRGRIIQLWPPIYPLSMNLWSWSGCPLSRLSSTSGIWIATAVPTTWTVELSPSSRIIKYWWMSGLIPGYSNWLLSELRKGFVYKCHMCLILHCFLCALFIIWWKGWWEGRGWEERSLCQPLCNRSVEDWHGEAI